MNRLVLKDAQGQTYCGKCGATRNARGISFSQLPNPEQGVRGHLKTCRGVAGVEERKRDLLAQIDAPPSTPPTRPTPLPAQSARQQPADSRWQPAVAIYRPPHRAALAGPVQPAGALDHPSPSVQAELAELRDALTLERHEKERYRAIAEEALALATNHEPHLALAGAANSQVSPLVYVLGGAAALGLIGWALGLFDTADAEPTPALRGRHQPSRPSLGSGLGNVLDVGSKVLGFVKNARGAFKF